MICKFWETWYDIGKTMQVVLIIEAMDYGHPESRNKRRAIRNRIRHDQATKSALLWLGDGADRGTYRRSRTPSTEIMSEENVLTPANHRKVSPKSTAAIKRNNRNFLRVLRKSSCKVKVTREAEEAAQEADEPSNLEHGDYKQNSKMPRYKKHQRQ